jgi:hypothetical protein
VTASSRTLVRERIADSSSSSVEMPLAVDSTEAVSEPR